MIEMEEGILTEEKKPGLIRKAIDTFIMPRGFKRIKANIDPYDTPARLNRDKDEEAFIPDATGYLNGRKSYFELILKTDRVRPLVTKLKLLSKLAGYRRGKLYLIVPNGHYAFTNRILDKYPVKAKILRM